MRQSKYGYGIEEPTPHVATIDFEMFYGGAFAAIGDLTLYERASSQPVECNRPKVLLHQVARMVWIGDRIEEVANGRPSFQVMFYTIAAEAAAKIFVGFDGKGESRKHVLMFFTELCISDDLASLTAKFRNPGGSSLSAERLAQFLYDVRCLVAHQALYYHFSLASETNGVEMLSLPGDDRMVSTTATLGDLRETVLRGAASSCKRLLAGEGCQEALSY